MLANGSFLQNHVELVRRIKKFVLMSSIHHSSLTEGRLQPTINSLLKVPSYDALHNWAAG